MKLTFDQVHREVEAMVGRWGGPFFFPIEQGKVSEFTRAISAKPIATTELRFAPPTYPVAISFWTDQNNAPWADQTGPLYEAKLQGMLVHGGQRFEYPLGPLAVGSELVGKQAVLSVRKAEGRRLGEMLVVDFGTELHAGRNLVANMSSIMIFSESMVAAKSGTSNQGAPNQPASLPSGNPLPDLIEGPLRVTDFVRYQGASGDFHPMHHDYDIATAAGFKSPYAIGMRQAGVMAQNLADEIGAETIASVNIEFKELAWPGDILTYSGTRSGTDIHMVATRGGGGVHIKGSATIREGRQDHAARTGREKC